MKSDNKLTEIKTTNQKQPIKETESKFEEEYKNYSPMKKAALKFREAIKVLPLSIFTISGQILMWIPQNGPVFLPPRKRSPSLPA